MKSSNKLAAIVRRTILPISIFAACADLPTVTPSQIKQQGLPVDTTTKPTTPANNYKPEFTQRPAYEPPTISNLLNARDRDGKGVGIIVEYTKPDGTKETQQFTSADSSLSRILQYLGEPADVAKIHYFRSRAHAQGDSTDWVRDSVVVPAIPVIIPPVPAGALLDPQGLVSGKTRQQRVYDLIESMFVPDKHIAEIRTANGVPILVVPWYASSDNTAISNLRPLPNNVPASYDSFILVTDEHSEVSRAVAMGTNSARMYATVNAIDLLKDTWKAKVETRNGNTVITPLVHDRASDATARYLHALYTCAGNPSFDAALQSLCKTRGDALAESHLAKEFSSVQRLLGIPEVRSPSTGRMMKHLSASGVNDAAGGGWTYGGYLGDEALGLIKAYRSTQNPVYLERALDIAAQTTDAANFNPSNPTTLVPFEYFKWSHSNGVLTVTPSEYWARPDVKERTGAHDGVRILNADVVVRAFERAGVGSHPVVDVYRKWVDAVRPIAVNGNNIQGMKDGTMRNGGSDSYRLSLVGGMLAHDTPMLATKLDAALLQRPTIRGVYEDIRGLLATGSAIGLDYNSH